MKWFGEHWGATICENEQVPTPVGSPCYLCNDKPIEEGDNGIYFDAVTGIPSKPEFIVLAAHLRCFMLSFTDDKAGIDLAISMLYPKGSSS